MSEIKRSMLVYIPAIAEAAAVLTERGRIVGIDHEGTISFEMEGEDEFELGRISYELEHELETLSSGRGTKILSARQAAAHVREQEKALVATRRARRTPRKKAEAK